MSDDIESENLAAHVKICQLRYEALDNKIDEVNNKVNDINLSIKSLADSITKVKDNNTNKAEKIAGYVIYGLLLILGSIASHIIFK